MGQIVYLEKGYKVSARPAGISSSNNYNKVKEFQLSSAQLQLVS